MLQHHWDAFKINFALKFPSAPVHTRVGADSWQKGKRAELGAGPGDIVFHGVMLGLSAGAVLAVTQILIGAALGNDPLLNLKSASAMIPGLGVLKAAGDLALILAIGVLVHFSLSIAFGLLLSASVGSLRKREVEPRLWLLLGWGFGAAMWLMNFVVIAPLMWPQFARIDQFWNGILPYTFVFGTTAALYLSATAPQQAKAAPISSGADEGRDRAR